MINNLNCFSYYKIGLCPVRDHPRIQNDIYFSVFVEFIDILKSFYKKRINILINMTMYYHYSVFIRLTGGSLTFFFSGKSL